MIIGVLALLVGCQAGPVGPEGSAGPPGMPGEPGAEGPTGPVGLAPAEALQWLDATGAVVAESAALVFFDPDGWVWTPDPITGALNAGYAGPIWFETDDCSSVGWLEEPPAGEVIELNDDRTVVRPAGVALETRTAAGGEFAPGTCTPLPGWEAQGVLMDELVEVQRPTPFTGPLHTEPVGAP